MSDIFPLPVWIQGTTQPSTPVNEAFLRTEVLARGAVAISSTPPGSPSDGDVHIVGASPTGAWSSFSEHDVVLWRAGTWYRFAPFRGWVKEIGGDLYIYDGADWVEYSSSGVGFANPMTSAGDLIVGSTGGVAQRLGIGASGQVLKVVSGAPQWADESGGGGGGGDSLPVFFDGALIPQGFTAGFSVIGHSNPIFTGSSSGGGFNVSSAALRYPHRSASATAATNAIAGIRQNDGSKFICRNAGFYFCSAVCPSSGASISSHRLFCGLIDSTAAPTDVNPSTLTNFVALGYDSGDSQVQIMHNDGSGTATKIALGSSFPKPTADDSAWYFLELRCEKEGSSIDYRVLNPISGAEASGSISSDMPSLTTSMNFYQWMSAGGTSTGISLRMGTLRLRI